MTIIMRVTMKPGKALMGKTMSIETVSPLKHHRRESSLSIKEDSLFLQENSYTDNLFAMVKTETKLGRRHNS